MEAVRRHRIPRCRWLDLSSGINPNGWPIPEVPAPVWQRLPEEDGGLERAAAAYYGSSSLLPVAGTQAAIQTLPRLRPAGRVGILTPGYSEHARAWSGEGHRVEFLEASAIDHRIDRLDVLVLCHPNNPDGRRFPRQALLSWQRRLAQRDGWLVVDEAFMDMTPRHSLATHCPGPGLILLRSPGKFFGLAGVRLGFVLAEPELLQRLRALLGPWAVSGPARWLGERALADRRWQQASRSALRRQGQRLSELLTSRGLPPAGGTALFQWVPHPRAGTIRRQLAAQAIWVRLFPELAALRFGLPGSEAGWSRLEAALEALSGG